MIEGSLDNFNTKITTNSFDSLNNLEYMSNSSFLPSLHLQPMGSDSSKATLKQLDVMNEDGEFEITKISKYLELTISVRERNDGV